jgi:hypothetical protein
MHKPARYLVVIDSAGEMVARMFDEQRKLIVDFDASSSEVAVMTQGLRPTHDATDPRGTPCSAATAPRSAPQAEVYTLDV